MSRLKLKDIIRLLREFSRNGHPLEIILVGGLSMEYYGLKERATLDIDAEVKGDIEELLSFLKKNKIPADIGEDISKWSLISLPAAYRQRATTIHSDDNLKIKVLSPLDFIVAKLRRFTEEDLEDALFVARKFRVKIKDIRTAAEEAIKSSPKDTAIFIFKKNLEVFTAKFRRPPPKD